MRVSRLSIVPAGLLVAALGSGVGFALNVQAEDQEPGPSYPTLPDGRSLGRLPAEGDQLAVDKIPDLVAVVGDHGVEGYADARYILGKGEPAPRSPAEALAMQRDRPPTTTVLVYAEDGVTIVDTFTIDNRPLTGTDPEQG